MCSTEAKALDSHLLDELDFKKYPQKSRSLLSERRSCAQEFLCRNGERISRDDGAFCLNVSPTPSRPSNDTGPGSCPFWKEHMSDLSRRLSSRSSPTTFYPSFKSSVAGDKAIARKTELRMRRIKLNPTRWQKAVLWRFNGQCRFLYNAVAAARKLAPGDGRERPKLNFQELRNAFVTSMSTERDNAVDRKCRKPKEVDGRPVEATKNPFMERNAFLAYTPASLRQGAVKQYVAAEKAAWTNYRNGNAARFTMKFRSRKRERSWTLHLDKHQVHFDRATGRLVILKESLCSESEKYKPPAAEREAKFRRPKKQPGKAVPEETHVRFFEKPPFSGHPDHDCSISYSNGRFWLQVPYAKRSKACRTTTTAANATRPAIGIDPGGRDPLATFDTRGASRLLGSEETGELERLWRRREVIQALLARKDTTGKAREKLKRQLRKTSAQYVDRKTDLHHRLSSRLAKEHAAIFLPKLNLRHVMRTLRPNATRRFCAFGHGLFRTRLRDKCWQHGTWLPDVDERYTTQGCSACGGLHRAIGSSKVFDCPHCPMVMDRDANAAKNILLKHTTFVRYHRTEATLPDACEGRATKRGPLDVGATRLGLDVPRKRGRY